MASKIVVIDETEYTVSEPTREDWEWFDIEMRGEKIAAAKTAGLSGDDLQGVIERVANRSVLADDSMRWFFTPAGGSRLAYRMLKHKHPEVTLAQCHSWTTQKFQDGLFAAINELVFEPRVKRASSKNDQAGANPSSPTGTNSTPT